VIEYQFTWYFLFRVLPRRPYLQPEWCAQVIEDPVRIQIQRDGRIRFWGNVPELGGRTLRVVTLADGRTVHNAFPDRRFRP
jgi:hypothetical protein